MARDHGDGEKMKKKQRRIIIVWIISMIITGIFLCFAEKLNCTGESKINLYLQADTIAAQVPAFLEEDYLAQYGSGKMKECRINTICMLLRDAETITEVKKVMSDVVGTGNISGLTVYNRDGSAVYEAGEKHEEIDPEIVKELGKYDFMEIMNGVKENPEMYRELFFSSANQFALEEEYSWFKKSGKWIVRIDYRLTEKEKSILDYFSWSNVLQRIRVGENGFVLAIDENDGTVLSGMNSFDHKDLKGKKVDDLSIRIEGSNHDSDIQELNKTFRDTKNIIKIRVDGWEYYAIRIDADGVLMLAMLPLLDVWVETIEAVNTSMFLLILVTVSCLLYCLFYMSEKDVLTEKKRYMWNKGLSGKLTSITIVGVIVMISMGFLLKGLSFMAQSYNHYLQTADAAVTRYSENEKMTGELQDWFNEDYLARCRIAEEIIRHTDEDKITIEYLQKLCDCLDAKNLSVYDTDGRLIITNNSFGGNGKIDDNSPFSLLLSKYNEVSGELYYDEVNDEYLQEVGVTLLDSENRCRGIVLLETNANEIDKIIGNLGFDRIAEQTCLMDRNCFMVVNGDDMTIRYMAEMKDGHSVEKSDTVIPNKTTVSDLEINEKDIQNNFGGYIFTMNKYYYAVVRQTEEYYFVILISELFYSLTIFFSVFIQIISFLVFMCVMTFLSCAGKKGDLPETEVIQTDDTENEKESAEESAEEGTKGVGVLSYLASLTEKQKPYFEDRWAEDSVKWKDKSPSKKYSSAMMVVIALALLSVGFQAIFFRGYSPWYYCMAGVYERGLNVRTITVCVLYIGGLYLLKIILHKFLYYIARAADAKGETICHLLDSFSGYIIFILGVVLCLVKFGLNLKTLSLTGGVAGVVFGIGCQNIVADILAGILMCFEGVVHAGDFVMFNGNPGVVLSIGVRTTRLKWFGEITVVRNNEFKNYVNFPNDKQNRTTTTLTIDLHESLERVEAVLDKELPLINERLRELCQDEISGPKYRGVSQITENGVVLSFGFYCKSMYSRWMLRNLNRELKLMCERNNITIAMNQVVVNEPMENYTELPEED